MEASELEISESERGKLKVSSVILYIASTSTFAEDLNFCVDVWNKSKMKLIFFLNFKLSFSSKYFES